MSAPKKSHAFIITFVLILLLLLIGYWLFTNKDKIFKTGGLNLGRIFEPLVESPDRKPLEIIWDRIFNPGETTNTTDSNGFVYDPNNNIHNFPVVNINANPSSVKEGESSTISWTSTNSMSCETGSGTQVGTSGTFSTGPLSKSQSFTVNCRGANGNISNSVIVKIGDRKINPYNFPSVSGNANPSPINAGESSTISWESNNATSCNAGAGKPTTTSGRFSTGPLYSTTSYSIVCTGKDGTSGRNIFVIVKNDVGLEYDKCENGTDNYPFCTTKNGQCINGATNPDLCTTSADGKCLNGAINPTACTVFEHPFCVANKITTILYMGNKDNDKTQVTSLQSILSKLPSSLGTTYLKETDVDGGFGLKTKNAVALFQKDNNLTQKNGTVDGPTMNALNNKCNEFFNNENNSSISQCNDGIDNDNKEGIDGEDPSCHSDFNKNNASSYDKKIRDEGRTKTDTECGDGINNDNEEGPDYLDKDCHIDGNINNWESYYKDINFEKSKGLPTPTEVCGNKAINYPACNKFENTPTEQCKNPLAVNYPQCDKDKDGKCLNGSTNANCKENIEKNKCAVFDQYPLEFTDKEKAELAELLRKFYLLAPMLKTEDDLNLVFNEINRYEALIKETKELTKQCYLESASKEEWLYNGTEPWSFCSRNPKLCEPTDTFNRSYTGPTTRFGNPWFKPDSVGSYVDKTKYGEVKINTDLDYLLKIHGEDTVSPLLTKYPPAQMGRSYRLNWHFPTKPLDMNVKWTDLIPIYNVIDRAIESYTFVDGNKDKNIINSVRYDLNAIMLDRLQEFETLLNIW